MTGVLPRPPSATHAEATAAGTRGVTVYWRSGCPFCTRLRVALLGRTDRARWVDIHADPEAAAFVRSVNGGDETVPTVVIDGQAHTNPSPLLVRRALGG